MSQFFRFPHTAHLRWLSEGLPRDDKILSAAEVAQLLSGEVTIEEKVDGANIGISLDDAQKLLAQNRGQVLTPPFRGQFSRLPGWHAAREDTLRSALADTILFGEWCTAVHSISYDRLPDWFLLFDVYDRVAGRFYSSERRNEFADRCGLALVPQLGHAKTTVEQLIVLMTAQKSSLGDALIEGVVVRKDVDGWNEARGKLVRASFVQTIEVHWKNAPLRWNRLAVG